MLSLEYIMENNIHLGYKHGVSKQTFQFSQPGEKGRYLHNHDNRMMNAKKMKNVKRDQLIHYLFSFLGGGGHEWHF